MLSKKELDSIYNSELISKRAPETNPIFVKNSAFFNLKVEFSRRKQASLLVLHPFIDHIIDFNRRGKGMDNR